jgi:hypothetical protein
MISEEQVDDVIRKLDAQLAGRPHDQPIAMGIDVFAALVKRGLVADHIPAPIGGEGDQTEKTTYRDTHPAQVDPHLPDDAFSVGQ